VRIACFTPLASRFGLPPVSVAAAEALAGLGHQVSIWTPERAKNCVTPAVPVVRFARNPLQLSRLLQMDVCLYALSEDYRQIRDVALAMPGILMLEDHEPNPGALDHIPAGAWGAVCHSHTQARDLRTRWFGPVCALSLPVTAQYAQELTEFVHAAVGLSAVMTLADRAGRALADLAVSADAPAARIVENRLSRIASAPEWSSDG
jgi:hypothetical protein